MVSDVGVPEKEFLDKLDLMVERFKKISVQLNPVVPTVTEIKNMFIRSYYGR